MALIFIWRGWGWLVPAGFFLVPLVMQLVVEALGGTYRGSDQWPGVALVLAGAIDAVVGLRLNRESHRSSLADRGVEQGAEARHHDFFFLRMEWWAIPIVIGGVFILMRSSA